MTTNAVDVHTSDGTLWPRTEPYLWRGWTTATDSTASTKIWSQWVTDTYTETATATGFTLAYGATAPPILTPAQIAQEKADRIARDERIKVRERLNKEADERALQLMRKWLSPAEWECYSKKGYIDITCPSGMIYRIEKGSNGNVKEMVKGPDGRLRTVAHLCAQPDGIPLPDVNLSQYLHLLGNEEEFRRIANRWVR